MDYKLLNIDEPMPMLGLGTSALRDEECTRAVQSALDLGYRHIDTAEMYGNEDAIGTAIAGTQRDELFITSKVWREEPLRYGDVFESCHASLKRLGTDYLDLYLIHWPNRRINYPEIFEALGQLHDEGLIRALGVSNFTISHLQNSIKICDELDLEISVNQVEFHVGLYQRELLEFCDQHDIAITAYTPLGKGNLIGNEVVGPMADAHNKSPQQIALRWLLQQGLVAIPKAAQRTHQEANLDVFDFELSEDEMSQLNALGDDQRLVEPAWAEFE